MMTDMMAPSSGFEKSIVAGNSTTEPLFPLGFDGFHHLGGRSLQRGGQNENGFQTGVLEAALQLADVAAVVATFVGQVFLGDAFGRSNLPEDTAKQLFWSGGTQHSSCTGEDFSAKGL